AEGRKPSAIGRGQRAEGRAHGRASWRARDSTMIRFARFRFVSPQSIAEAADVLASATAGDAMVVAGGTDLIPNMKRRQQTPGTLVGLRRIPELQRIANGDGLAICASVTLTRIVHALAPAHAPAAEGLT